MKYQMLVKCSNEVNGKKCKEKLLSSKIMTKEEIRKEWTLMVISAPLNTPRCPKCKYSTFSDCNSGSFIEIIESKSKKIVKDHEKFLNS